MKQQQQMEQQTQPPRASEPVHRDFAHATTRGNHMWFGPKSIFSVDHFGLGLVGMNSLLLLRLEYDEEARLKRKKKRTYAQTVCVWTCCCVTAARQWCCGAGGGGLATKMLDSNSVLCGDARARAGVCLHPGLIQFAYYSMCLYEYIWVHNTWVHAFVSAYAAAYWIMYSIRYIRCSIECDMNLPAFSHTHTNTAWHAARREHAKTHDGPLKTSGEV